MTLDRTRDGVSERLVEKFKGEIERKQSILGEKDGRKMTGEKDPRWAREVT